MFVFFLFVCYNTTYLETGGKATVRTIQEASNEIAKKAGYKGDFMTTQSALNYIAENIGVLSSGVGGEEELTPDEGFVDKNTGVIIDEWLGEQEEYDSAIKFANRRYSIYSKQGELLKQYCTRFKSPLDYFDNRLSMYFSVGENGLSYWNNPNDPMPIQIDGNKTLEQCKIYEDENRVIYSDGKSVKVLSDEGFYEYYLRTLRKLEEVSSTPTDEKVKDQKYYENIIYFLESEYNKKIKTKNFKEISIPVSINFAVTVYKKEGIIYIGEGKTEEGVNLPSGKLAFITNATSETHSFVMNNIKLKKHSADPACYVYSSHTSNNENSYIGVADESFNGNHADFILSNLYKEYSVKELGQKGTPVLRKSGISGGNIRLAGIYSWQDSFSRLLLYKGNFTQVELERELAKDIRLK